MNKLDKSRPGESDNHYDAVHHAVEKALEERKNAYNGWKEQRFQELRSLAEEADLLADGRKKGQRRKYAS